MSLVRWMRKNHTRIMVIVLVIIMVGFVIGASLPVIINQMANRLAAGKVIATYGDDGKITRVDYAQARTDLNILQQLYANEYLNIVPTPTRTPNYKTILIGQMLFPDQRAALISNAMKMSALRGELLVTADQIDDFFIQLNNTTPEIYWLLLNAEANNAGCTIAPSDAKIIVDQIIPYITQGRPASQLIRSLISEHRLTEEQIYNTFAKLIAIEKYVDMVTTSEDVTIDQVRALLARNMEKISAELIKIDANISSSRLTEPTDKKIDEYFQKYKAILPAEISAENPFGFGYKLPASVELEYLIVKTQDVEKLIEKPTNEELEEYYQYNSSLFTYQEPTDPGDPESEKITKTRDYAQVMGQIQTKIIQERAARRANMIMNDAVEITEANLAGLDIEKPTSKTYAQHAVPFSQAAQNLKEKHNIDIYTGKTGRLSLTELTKDAVLGRLTVSNQNSQTIDLGKIAFAIEEIGQTKMGRFDIATPKMFQNIGPMKNAQDSMTALVRVVATYSEAEPENIDVSFSRKTAVIEKRTVTLNDDFNVKDEVIKDIKTVEAMEVAKASADKLLALINKKGWDDAIKAFNKTKKKEQNPVRLSSQQNKSRSSLLDNKTVEASISGNPAAEMYKRARTEDTMLTEKLYSLLPNDKNEVDDLKKVFAFEPQKSYYIVKSIQKQSATEEEYYKNKNSFALLLDMNRSMSLAFTHLSPENLLKRTNLEIVKQQQDEQTLSSDENTQTDEQKEEEGS